ncbi:MAG: OmpA family protein [Marinibacterium profundimaris]|uniref:Membrane protein n=2 Tax=Marinibacterium profundimaris TaxID=1679460 RepID=A0A225NL20_9RHOB|nr:OmpA family protein [Marinibacterium profundimaris]OWU70452.1 membrane protein [Marinibacterium profundimaris]
MASALALVLLAGCNYEAGYEVDGGTFGDASYNNEQVQTGAKQYVDTLNDRFSAEVPTTITFAFDSAYLDNTARATLTRQAQWIRQFPEVRFSVYGHTDAVGSAAYNKQLGLRRAQAAVAYLTSHGISRSRLEALVSFGETQPAIVTSGRERANRRTVTQVSGFVGRHPTVMDGKYAQIIYRDYVQSAASATTLTGIESEVLAD